ncbi:MAG TPA: Rieske 2Fe-2S domain-containing protein [Dehalococcoidia bacterium]|nr:Rieske 2Fe-2S domain-containing protein [Dehalococcoidia bacterium]
MLTKEHNELLTRTGPGTPMGELFRRFWLPVLLSEELPAPDCTPVRFRILSEDLVGFKDSGSRAGILEAYCPHRGAPLFFGRNEENGLRCVYHGWKFDAAGSCVDLPNAIEGDSFKDKVEIISYPAVDTGGFIWAYMGPREVMPPLPQFEFMDLPETHRGTWKIVSDCNYFQSLEGAIDSTHGAFLHSTPDPTRSPRAKIGLNVAENLNPRSIPQYVHVEDTEYGVLGVVERQRANGDTWVRVSQLVLPTFVPGTGGQGRPNLGYLRTRIPIDDATSAVFRIWWDAKNPMTAEYRNELNNGDFLVPEMEPGRFRPKANKDNNYLIDRVAQKNFTFTGISSFPLQDVAVIEDQRGPVMDRTRERLTSADAMIIRVRDRLLRAARDLLEGTEPSLPHKPELFRAAMPQTVVKAGEAVEPVVQRLREAAVV